VAGKSRGSQSAERIGGGAVIGAVIGAIAGGGKGAAIGAGVGAGAGTAVQVMTHGDRLRIPSETLLEFKLEHDVTAPLGATSN
jgi:outer membrane lipoprotein SlyB